MARKLQIIGSFPSGGGSGESGGMSAAASALLITILRNGVYTADQSANIKALEATLASVETPASGVEQIGGILAIVSGVTAAQSGSVLSIA